MTLRHLTALVLLLVPFLSTVGCGGSSGPAELGQTYEPVSADERKAIEEEKEALGADFVPPE